jgi:hypothetical protein
VTGALKHAAPAVASLSAVVAVLARDGVPAVAALAGVVVLVLAAVCWVLGDKDRSDRAARIILGIRGDARCLDPAKDPEHPSESGAALAIPAPVPRIIKGRTRRHGP